MIRGVGGSGVGPWFKVLSGGSKLFQPSFQGGGQVNVPDNYCPVPYPGKILLKFKNNKRLEEDLSINFTCARSIFKDKNFIILGKV